MRKAMRIVGRLLAIACVAVALAGAFVTWRGYGMYREALAACSLEDAVEELRSQEGYTPIDDMPQRYLDAVVAVEDHRFYTHGGIDPISIGRAAVNDIRTMSLAEGGSTITQQLAKNLFFTQEKDFSRKVAEVFMAFDIEASYDKGDILELYVNTSYFGDGLTGIGAACRGYLGKAPHEMSPCECALMAGLPNAPSALSGNPELAWDRARLVASQMQKYEMPTARLVEGCWPTA